MANPNQNQHGKLPSEQPDDKDRQRGGNSTQERDRSGEEGRKGSQHSGGGTGNPGNFANDRDKGSDAGRKGGQSSQGGRTDR